MVASSLELLALDYVFMQDGLLFPESFVKEAKRRGFDVELETLDVLHAHQLLTPLFRVGHPRIDPTVAQRPDGYGNNTSRDLVFDAALQGVLHDPAREDKVASIRALNWDDHERDDWTMYLYSPWQLLDLGDLRPALDGVDTEISPGQSYLDWYRPMAETQVETCRSRTLALAALSTRYLWRVTGQLGLSPMADRAKVFESFKVDPKLLLDQVGYDSSKLQSNAIGLLMGPNTHMDPCRDWLPLMRHMDYESWLKLRGAGLAAVWSRIGGEILLRCHADLRGAGLVEPLTVDIDAERLNRSVPPDIDQALASFDLLPYPVVLLLVEGETEMEHFPALLKLAGVDGSQYVHVMRAGTKGKPELLARFVTTPRVSNEISWGWRLSRRPTVLYIIMDPENDWRPANFDEALEGLKKKIRAGVEEQGAQVDDATLNHVVRAQTWLSLTGRHLTYELANFTADELVEAMRPLARVSTHYGKPDTPEWESKVRDAINMALINERPESPAKIGKILERLSIDKTDLAKALLPKLQEKYSAEVSAGAPTTPIVRVVEEVRKIVRTSHKHIALPK